MAAGTLNVSTLTDGTNSVSIEQTARGVAKAWVVFNGTGTVAVLNSYNVTSVSDDAAGKYTINFTKPMKNLNYVFSGSGRWNTTASAAHIGHNKDMVKSLTALPFQASNSTTGNAIDLTDINVVIHGD